MLNPIDDAWSMIKMNDPHEDDYSIEDDPYGDSNQTFDDRYIYELIRRIKDDGKTHNDIYSALSSGQKGADTRKRNNMLNQNWLAELEQRKQERYRRGEIPYPINRSEPMELAFQLLKERVSPEAKRHKLEYDKQYESSPERVKYREDLNRERRRRGIYGSHDHKDVSHTKGGKLTLEGEHENRARHFKEKGTLRDLKMGGVVGHLVGAVARR